MAWTTPRTWVAGEVVTGAVGNTHWRDNFNFLGSFLKTGTLSPTPGLLHASGTAPVGIVPLAGRNAQVLQYDLTNGTYMWKVDTWLSRTGTFTATAETTLNSIAISTLEAADALVINYAAANLSAGTSQNGAFLDMNGIRIATLAIPIQGTRIVISQCVIKQAENSTRVFTIVQQFHGTMLTVAGDPAVTNVYYHGTMGGTWTSPITLALIGSAFAAPGTMIWNWSVRLTTYPP